MSKQRSTHPTSKKPSVQPDVSPKKKEGVDPHEVVVAIVIIIMVVVASVLLTLGLSNNYENDLRSAIAKAEEREAVAEQKQTELFESSKKLMEREKEVEKREVVATSREKKLEELNQNLTEREEALATERALFEVDKADFYASQERVFELSEALADELRPGYEKGLPDSTTTRVYTDPDDPDLEIEEIIEE